MENHIAAKIKSHFDIKENPARIPVLNGKKTFTARLEEDGISVDNLGNQPFLPWEVFSQAINCLKENGGQVKKGNAANSRLGDSNLELNTLEGYIASKVYGCKIGDTVFKRIVPIASILAWAEICKNSRGQICLLPEETDNAFDALEYGEKDNLPLEIKEKEESSEGSPVPATFKSRDDELQDIEKLDINTLKDKLKAQLAEIERYESELGKSERERSNLAADLQILAGKFIAADSEIRKLEDKLLGKEKRINNLEVALTSSEEKVKKLEKELSDRKGEENLAVQLREKDELIKQLKGTLASKEEEFSRLNEENRRYKRQQKFESEGLKQIQEQKAAKKWWKNW